MKTLLPQIFDINVNVSSLIEVSEISEGIETSYYIVGSDREEYFIKFLTSDYFESEGFICGGELLPLLDKRDVPVPSLVYCSDPDLSIGTHPYYITEYVEGETQRGYDNVGSIERYRSYFQLLGEYTAKLNSVPVNSQVYGWAGWFNDWIEPFGGYPSFTEWVAQEVRRYANKLTTDHSCYSRKDQILSLAETINSLSIDSSDPVVCTYDRKFSNVIMDNTAEPRAKALIDWDNPVLAPPEYMVSCIEKNYVTHPRMDSSVSYDLEPVLSYILQGYNKQSNTPLDLHNNPTYTVARVNSFVSDIRHFDNYYEDYSTTVQDNVREQLFGALNALEDELANL
jgi:aminoglycoside phosphotransferase (APT) family kinase protein